jgi:hypothetical protein
MSVIASPYWEAWGGGRICIGEGPTVVADPIGKMPIMNRKIIAFAAAALALPGLAFAANDADLFPHIVTDGGEVSVEYGSAPNRNVVGGADSVFVGNDGNQPQFRTRAETTQQRTGEVARVENQNGRNELVYAPIGAPTAPRRS